MTDSTKLWMRDAACKGLDTEMFYPQQGVALPLAVRRICAGCPVRNACLEYAANEKFGVWAGVSPKARREMRRGRTRRSCPACHNQALALRDNAIQACTACGLSWRIREHAASQAA